MCFMPKFICIIFLHKNNKSTDLKHLFQINAFVMYIETVSNSVIAEVTVILHIFSINTFALKNGQLHNPSGIHKLTV